MWGITGGCGRLCCMSLKGIEVGLMFKEAGWSLWDVEIQQGSECKNKLWKQ